MRAKVLQPFTAGSAKYQEGQIVDFEDWRFTRLVGEGLVVAAEDVSPAPEDTAPVEKVKKPRAPKKISRRKK